MYNRNAFTHNAFLIYEKILNYILTFGLIVYKNLVSSRKDDKLATIEIN